MAFRINIIILRGTPPKRPIIPINNTFLLNTNTFLLNTNTFQLNTNTFLLNTVFKPILLQMGIEAAEFPSTIASSYHLPSLRRLPAF